MNAALVTITTLLPLLIVGAGGYFSASAYLMDFGLPSAIALDNVNNLSEWGAATFLNSTAPLFFVCALGFLALTRFFSTLFAGLAAHVYIGDKSQTFCAYLGIAIADFGRGFVQLIPLCQAFALGCLVVSLFFPGLGHADDAYRAAKKGHLIGAWIDKDVIYVRATSNRRGTLHPYFAVWSDSNVTYLIPTDVAHDRILHVTAVDSRALTYYLKYSPAGRAQPDSPWRVIALLAGTAVILSIIILAMALDDYRRNRQKYVMIEDVAVARLLDVPMSLNNARSIRQALQEGRNVEVVVQRPDALSWLTPHAFPNGIVQRALPYREPSDLG